MTEKSVAYNDFIRQMDATGYQKAQGYDPNLLDKIKPNEQEEVEKLIVELFKNGDRGTAMFLPKLKMVDGISLLKNELMKWPAPSIVNAELSLVLWRSTGEMQYQDLLINDLNIKSGAYRSAIVGYLLEFSPNERLKDVFDKIRKEDSDKLARYKATIGLLYCLDLIKDPLSNKYDDKIRELIKQLSSDIEEDRAAGEKRLAIMSKTELER
jgi:hypothetical protein